MCCSSSKSKFLWLPLVAGVFVVGFVALHHSRRSFAEPPKPLREAPPAERAQPKKGFADEKNFISDKEPAPVIDGKDAPEMIPPPKQQGKQGRPHVTVTVNGPNAPKQLAPPVFETKAEGFGDKEEDATQAAENDACARVAKYLAQTYGEAEYPLTNEELKAIGITPAELKTKGIIGQPQFEVVDLANAKQKAVVDVKLNAEQVGVFRNKAREQRVVGRVWTAGGVLAGLMALLLVGGGYLRLEEATKGYYTALLRVGALVVLGTVAAALFMLFGVWH
jgi:hypothetical protein